MTVTEETTKDYNIYVWQNNMVYGSQQITRPANYYVSYRTYKVFRKEKL